MNGAETAKELSNFPSIIDQMGESRVRLGLFDPQVLAPLDWLASVTETSEQQIRALVEQGILPKRIGHDGGLGFTIFTEAQIRFMRELRQMRIYPEEEIRHVIWYENMVLENCWLAALPYDDQHVGDPEHFKRRIEAEIRELRESEDFYRRRRSQLPLSDGNIQQKIDEIAVQRTQLERISIAFSDKREGELSDAQRRIYRKLLYRMRWADEWALVQNVNQYESQVRQGFSPEFEFQSWSSEGPDRHHFGSPEWGGTIGMYQMSRSMGRRFPLRTPDFTFSEAGFALRAGVSPDEYRGLFDAYGLDELFKIVTELGEQLWNPTELAEGFARCPECSGTFQLENPRRVYCSEKCRERAKHRRWRQNDPEGARSAQARYFIRNYPELRDA